MSHPTTFYHKERAEAKAAALREQLFQTMIVYWPLEGYERPMSKKGYVIMFRSYSFEPWHYLVDNWED